MKRSLRIAGLSAALAGLGTVLYHENEIIDSFREKYQENHNQEQVYEQPAVDVHRIVPQELHSVSYTTTDFAEDSDTVLLARMIFGEARSCSYTERVAVGYSAVNRVDDGKKWNGENIGEVVLKPWQYSCFNDGDPNKEKLMDPEKYNARVFEECLEVAHDVLSGTVPDPTGGATHYFDPKHASPSWADKMEKIGNISTETGSSVHVFYRE